MQDAMKERDLHLYCLYMKQDAAMHKYEVRFSKPSSVIHHTEEKPTNSVRMDHIEEHIHYVAVKVQAKVKEMKYRYVRLGVDADL